MRIGVSALVLSGSPEALRSGIGRYAFELVDALLAIETEHEFVVWTGRDFDAPARWREHPRASLRCASGLFAGYKTLWEWFAAGRAAGRSSCDIWFSSAHALPCGWPGGWSGPSVLSVQDLFTFTHPEFYTVKHRLVVGRAMRRALRQADGIVAISRHTGEALVSDFGVAPDRISVTPLASAQRRSVPEPADEEPEALGEKGRFLLTLSTIEPRKNLPRLFAAFDRLTRREEFADLRLVVAGAEGWRTRASLEGPARLGIADRVEFAGFVEDRELARLLRSCAGFVLPSIIEGFGLPLLEAMEAGAPCASSRTGSLPEVGGHVPVYFDPLDVHDMERAFAELLTMKRSRDEWARLGSERAASFSWQATAQATLERIEAAAR